MALGNNDSRQTCILLLLLFSAILFEKILTVQALVLFLKRSSSVVEYL